jgi:hypothetical protein
MNEPDHNWEDSANPAISALRRAAWERAKGELRAFVSLRRSEVHSLKDGREWMESSGRVTDFEKEVEQFIAFIEGTRLGGDSP